MITQDILKKLRENGYSDSDIVKELDRDYGFKIGVPAIWRQRQIPCHSHAYVPLEKMLKKHLSKVKKLNES